jgi:hypothetical protein
LRTVWKHKDLLRLAEMIAPLRLASVGTDLALRVPNEADDHQRDAPGPRKSYCLQASNEIPMRVHRVAVYVLALIALAGCAQTRVTSLQPYEGERIARPNRIIVHDFATTPADVPAGPAVGGQYPEPTTPQTAKEIEVGRQLGAQVAKELVAEINGMGLPAVQAAGQPPPLTGDIVIMGYFESVDSGSLAKRIVLGFGSGSAHLNTSVEAS